MEYSEMLQAAIKVKEAYDKLNVSKGQQTWSYREYTEGLVRDVGGLMEMVMAKSNLRGYSRDLNSDLKHEVVDCMWALMMIAEELKIDLSQEFIPQVTKLAADVEGKI